MNVLLMLLLLLLLLLLCSAEQRPVPDARVPLDGAQRRLRVGPHAGHGRLRGPRLVAQRRRLRPQRHQVRTPFPQKKKTTKDVGRGASLFEASVSTAGRVLQLGRNAQVLTLAVGGASLEPVSRLLDASRI